MTAGTQALPSTGLAALRERRAYRRRKKLDRLEWFESAYRVYLTAIVGGFVVLVLVSYVGGTAVTDQELASITTRGPAVLGMLGALAIATGLRSGSRGGPVAVEPAEVRFVLLAPVDRRGALAPLAAKTLRSLVSAGLGCGVIVGLLADRRLPGDRLEWAAAGAGFGIAITLAYAGAALLASGLRIPRWAATTVGTVLLAGAAADVARQLPWPTTAVGSLALWPLRVRPLDLSFVGLCFAAAVIGLTMLGRLSLDDAERRTRLVGGIRVAVTLQDVRSVLVLRRQLVVERPLNRPWVPVPKWFKRWPVWRRGWQGFARTPLSRILRIVLLLGVVGITSVIALRGTPAILLLGGLAAYLAGLDLVEPLALAVDNSDRTDLLPIEDGSFRLRLLTVPAVVAVVFGAFGGAIAQLVAQGNERPIALVTGITAGLAGLCGATVSVVMAAPRPASPATAMMPSEIAGAVTAARFGLPVLVACLGTAPTLLAARALSRADTTVSSMNHLVNGGFLALATIAFTAMWVRHGLAAQQWWATQLDAANNSRKPPTRSEGKTT